MDVYQFVGKTMYSLILQRHVYCFRVVTDKTRPLQNSILVTSLNWPPTHTFPALQCRFNTAEHWNSGKWICLYELGWLGSQMDNNRCTQSGRVNANPALETWISNSKDTQHRRWAKGLENRCFGCLGVMERCYKLTQDPRKARYRAVQCEWKKKASVTSFWCCAESVHSADFMTPSRTTLHGPKTQRRTRKGGCIAAERETQDLPCARHRQSTKHNFRKVCHQGRWRQV